MCCTVRRTVAADICHAFPNLQAKQEFNFPLDIFQSRRFVLLSPSINNLRIVTAPLALAGQRDE